MSKSIENRLERIEQTLSIGEEHRDKKVFIISRCDDETLLGPIEQWETYKQAIDTDEYLVVFCSDQQKEIEARKQLQNETKGNNK